MPKYDYPCDTLGMLFKEQCRLAQDNLYQEIMGSNRDMLQMIPDGGMVGVHENSDSLIWSHSPIGFIDYARRDAAGFTPGLVPGAMQARGCDGVNGVVDANVSERSNRSCEEKRVTVDFNEGYRRVTCIDFRLPLLTRVHCAYEYEDYAPDEVAEKFTRYRQQLETWAMDNFNEQLRNAAIEYGQSNSSVVQGGAFNVSTGGWVQEPNGVLTIAFLKKWGQRWRGLARPGKLNNNNTDRSHPVTIRCPEYDWLRMVQAHRDAVFTGLTINLNYGEDPFKNVYQEFDGVRWIKDEYPTRGYFDGGRFVEIRRVIPDTEHVEAGVGGKQNPDYDACWTYCNGIKRRVVTLIQIIDPGFAMRKGLKNPWKPGTAMSTNNMMVDLVDGPDINALLDCGDNLDRNKWAWKMRHEWRFCPKFPELAGSIVYLHDNPCSYDIAPCCTDDCPTPAIDPANFQLPPKNGDEAQGEDACTIANKEKCGIPVDVANTIRLSSCGTVQTVYMGQPGQVRIRVFRTGTGNQPLTLAYTLGDIDALVGTHYEDVSATPGALTWEAGENSAKDIFINILGSSGVVGTDLSFAVALLPVAGVEFTNCSTLTVEIVHCDGVAPAGGCCGAPAPAVEAPPAAEPVKKSKKVADI